LPENVVCPGFSPKLIFPTDGVAVIDLNQPGNPGPELRKQNRRVGLFPHQSIYQNNNRDQTRPILHLFY